MRNIKGPQSFLNFPILAIAYTSWRTIGFFFLIRLNKHAYLFFYASYLLLANTSSRCEQISVTPRINPIFVPPIQRLYSINSINLYRGYINIAFNSIQL